MATNNSGKVLHTCKASKCIHQRIVAHKMERNGTVQAISIWKRTHRFDFPSCNGFQKITIRRKTNIEMTLMAALR